MMHRGRKHRVADVASLAEMASKLRRASWTTCTAFRFGMLVAANDSTGSDGAQEYAIVVRGRQVETLTVHWYDSDADLERSLVNLVCNSGANGDVDRNYDFGAVDVGGHPEGACHACQ